VRVATDTTIVHIADYAAPYPGSFVPMLGAAKDWVLARGWRFEVVLPPRAAERSWISEFGDDCPVRFLEPKPLLRAANSLRTRARHADGQCLLHTHFASFDLPAALAALAADTRVVWHRHGTLANRPKDLIRGAVKYGVLGRAIDAVVCCTPTLVPDLRRRGVPERKTYAIVNGIDCDRFGLAPAARRQEAREELGIAADDPIILHFGWHWEWKGGDLFLRALRHMRDRGPGVVGITVDGDDRASDLANELALDATRVRIVAPTPDVQRLYAAADLFVSPSRTEGMPFAILEALASGLPVVASDIPPHQYLAGVPNFRLARRNPRQLADAIEETLSRDPADAARAGEEARNWVRRHLDLEVWAKQLGAVYEQLLSHG
jgi:glycosyltransferase involved in cell wall biosynthesis